MIIWYIESAMFLEPEGGGRMKKIWLLLMLLLCSSEALAHQQTETVYVPTGAIGPEVLTGFVRAIDQSVKMSGFSLQVIVSREWEPTQAGFTTKITMSRTGFLGISSDLDYRLILKWDGNYMFETAGPRQYRCSGQWWNFSNHAPKTEEELLAEGKAMVEAMQKDK